MNESQGMERQTFVDCMPEIGVAESPHWQNKTLAVDAKTRGLDQI